MSRPHYLHDIQNDTVELYPTLSKIAKQVGLANDTIRQHINQMINNRWIISKRKYIRKDKLKSVTVKKRNYKQPLLGGNYNQFYMEQDNIRTVEDTFFGFDSIVGISKKPKHIYKLDEQEARQNGLQQIFTDSILYIDPTKHIYIKNDGFYYQLTMADRRYRGCF